MTGPTMDQPWNFPRWEFGSKVREYQKSIWISNERNDPALFKGSSNRKCPGDLENWMEDTPIIVSCY